MTNTTALWQHIQKLAPLTFADYMEQVLYDPDWGYYSQHQTAIGQRGDFFTSVSLGSDFGELLAVQLVQMWEILGWPEPFQIVEMGAGDGDLAADILNAIATNHPDCPVQYLIIERAAGKIAQQQQKLKDYPVQWCDWSELGEQSITGCFLANELVDAFPVHRVVVQERELKEIYVTIQNGKLTETMGELSTGAIATYFQDLEINLTADHYPDGYCTEVNLAAIDWLQTVASKLKQGYLLTIDYGYRSDRYYHPQRREGTLQAYYQHRHHNNPYVNLGQQDLTAHVNFSALDYYGQQAGLQTIEFTKQGLFLMALGLGDRLTALSTGQVAIQELFQRRDALHQLIDPAGLGNFGVLVQSKGLSVEQQQGPLQGLQIPEG